MKNFDRIFCIAAVLFLLAMAGMNFIIVESASKEGNREYRVALSRAQKELAAFEREEGRGPYDLAELQEQYGSRYDGCIVEIQSVKREGNIGDVLEAWSAQETEDYRFFVTEQYVYKLRYVNRNADLSKLLMYVNGTAVLLFAILVLFFMYVRRYILKPFHAFAKLPYEIAKGHLSKPLEESKNKYFGKYLWGMNLLRENLEESKVRELELQKEKKLLLLSLSHDIKTPLNAISLYAKAISKNLYHEEKQKSELAEKIHAKVAEIEGYMAEIIRASNQDFLTFEVENTEVYSKDVLVYIESYYREKMELNQIDFSMPPLGNGSVAYAENCLLFGDKDRIVEVLQNVIENAIKYGDGRRIRIMAARREEEYEMIVRNTGCTLPEAELSHIFDSFFRGSNVEKKKGSGLGLAICRRLMHLMEGEILADIIEDGNERIMEIRIVLHVI